MKKAAITAHMTVDDALRSCPIVVQLFVQMKLPCAGCSLGSFETMADVANAYQFRLRPFLQKMNQFVETANKTKKARQGV